MEQKKILIVVGTRPNFIKITQFKKKDQSISIPGCKNCSYGSAL